MTIDNRTLLEKADLAIADMTAGGGVLLPKQARRFMRLLIKQSVLMRQATVVPMSSDKQQVSKIKFGSRILRPGQENTPLALAERSAPDFSFVELDSQLYKGEVRISDEQLDDNIEGGQLRQTIMTLIAERVAADLEELIINGDRTSTDPFLATLDGVLVQATSHVVDAADATISKDFLRDLLKALPSQYRREKRRLRYLTASDVEIDYRNSLSERATGVGDKMLETDAPVLYASVPVVGVPLFPDDLGAASNQTNVLLCDPKNIQVGIRRRIKIESARDISAGTLKVVVTLRADVKLAEEPATAKLINLRV